MKSVLISTTLAIGLISSAAHAADQTITLNATVPGFCSVAGAVGTSSTDAAGAASPSTANATQADGTATFDVSNGSVTGVTNGTRTYGVTCNASATLQLISSNGGLTLTGPAPTAASGFTSRINYTATASGITTSNVVLTTTGVTNQTAGATGNVGGALTGASNLSLTIGSPSTGGDLLHAGSYTDTLTVRVRPTV